MAALRTARWDGTAWSKLGPNPYSGLTFGSGTNSMAVWGQGAGPDELYVMSDVVGANFNGVSRWNGTQWRAAASTSLYYWYLGYTEGKPSKLWSLDPDGPGPAVRTLYAAQTEISAYQTYGATFGSVWVLPSC